MSNFFSEYVGQLDDIEVGCVVMCSVGKIQGGEHGKKMTDEAYGPPDQPITKFVFYAVAKQRKGGWFRVIDAKTGEQVSNKKFRQCPGQLVCDLERCRQRAKAAN
jgi:hypothetical protein